MADFPRPNGDDGYVYVMCGWVEDRWRRELLGGRRRGGYAAGITLRLLIFIIGIEG